MIEMEMEKDSGADYNREQICEFIEDNPNCTIKHITEHFGYTKSQVTHYMTYLKREGYVSRKNIGRQGVRGLISVFKRTNKEYVRTKKLIDEEKIEAQQAEILNLSEQARAVSRVIRLSNRNMQPAYRKGEKLPHRGLSIQSSMSLFNKF